METSQPYRIYTPEALGSAIRHYRRKPALPRKSWRARRLNRTYLSDIERGKETEQVRRILRVLKQLGVRMTLDTAEW